MMASWEGTPVRFAFRCASCGCRFTVGNDAGPIYRCPRCEGLTLEQVSPRDGPVCDFCLGSFSRHRLPDVATWRYECNDYIISVLYAAPVAQGHSSAGDWAACERCHDLVEQGIDALVAAAAIELAADDRKDIPLQLRLLRVQWQGFYAHRRGEAKRL